MNNARLDWEKMTAQFIRAHADNWGYTTIGKWLKARQAEYAVTLRNGRVLFPDHTDLVRVFNENENAVRKLSPDKGAYRLKWNNQQKTFDFNTIGEK